MTTAAFLLPKQAVAGCERHPFSAQLAVRGGSTQQTVHAGCIGHLPCFDMSCLWEMPGFHDKKNLSNKVRINSKTAEVKWEIHCFKIVQSDKGGLYKTCSNFWPFSRLRPWHVLMINPSEASGTLNCLKRVFALSHTNAHIYLYSLQKSARHRAIFLF